MSSLFDFEFKIINPDPGGNLNEQVKDCVEQLGSLSTGLNGKAVIVRANWFYSKTQNSSCAQMQSIVFDTVDIKGLSHIPFTIIAESPSEKAMVQLVICLATNFSDKAIVESVNMDDGVYLRVKHGMRKWLFTGGSGCQEKNLSIRDSANKSLREIKAILENENLSFSNIIRQWNYIPGILNRETYEIDELVQNYQEFNKVRAAWFLKEGLDGDFPAATGIGVSGGEVNIEVIALDPVDKLQVYSLHNPKQLDAHSYTSAKLIGEKAVETPRFERGKMIFAEGKGHIWVSGTAAIRGEDSVPGGVQEQTLITCENIETLIDPKNLIRSGLAPGQYILEPVYIRAYVKNIDHGKSVLHFLEKRYSKAPVHVLQADVCREELLVEVEGEFKIVTSDK